MSYQPSEFELKMFERYKELCAKRDDTYAKTAPLEAELEVLNAKVEEYRVKAQVVATKIDEYFNSEHFSRKKEIAFLARALSKPGGLLATKE